MHLHRKLLFSTTLFVLAGTGVNALGQDERSIDQARAKQHGVLVVRHDLTSSEAEGKSELTQGDRSLAKDTQPQTQAAPSEKGEADSVTVDGPDSKDATAGEVKPRAEIDARVSTRPSIERVGFGASRSSNPLPRIRTFRSGSVYRNSPSAYRPLDMTYQPTRFRSYKMRTDWSYHSTSSPKSTPNRDWTYHRR